MSETTTESRTLQQIEQHLLDAVDQFPACTGVNFTFAVKRVDQDQLAGAWAVQIQATGRPVDRDKCEAAALQIVAGAINRFVLTLDS